MRPNVNKFCFEHGSGTSECNDATLRTNEGWCTVRTRFCVNVKEKAREAETYHPRLLIPCTMHIILHTHAPPCTSRSIANPTLTWVARRQAICTAGALCATLSDSGVCSTLPSAPATSPGCESLTPYNECVPFSNRDQVHWYCMVSAWLQSASSATAANS